MATKQESAATVAYNVSQPKRLGGTTGKGFMPGKSGNPSGKPKAYAGVVEAAREHTDTAIATLQELSKAADSDAARVAASNALLDRGWGKPTQPSVDLTPPKDMGPLRELGIEKIRLLIQLMKRYTPEELEKLAGLAERHDTETAKADAPESMKADGAGT